jgi:DNA gyrase subunit B
MFAEKNEDNEDYSASSLSLLEGLDAVRLRPAMYIGAPDENGLHHLLWEIIDNAIDEASEGYATHIDVVLLGDGSVEVTDNGRGIPTDIEPVTKLSGVELVFTKLHAGGKFGQKNYNSSGGLHGVGASVVNALSTKVDVEVSRLGKVYRAAFEKGVTTKGVHVVDGLSSGRSYTKVKFLPDSFFFSAYKFDFRRIAERCKQTAALVPNVTISVAQDNHKEVFRANNGLLDLVKDIAPNPIVPIIRIKGSSTYEAKALIHQVDRVEEALVTREVHLEVALAWTDDNEDGFVASWVNTIPTPRGGKHVSGAERALVTVVNEALREKQILKTKEENATREDIENGLILAISMKLPEPQFIGQTKEELGTPEAASASYRIVADFMRDFFATGNKRHVKMILEKIAASLRDRVASQKAKKENKATKSSPLPTKLVDCRRHGAGTELLIVEGDSAAGPAIGGRDASFQAILPVKGKTLNVEKASQEKTLANVEVQSLLSAIGAGYGRNFNIDEARYERIILLSDADVDGGHIRSLILTMLWKFTRPLFAEKKIFVALPPLYALKNSRETAYVFSDQERDEKLSQMKGQVSILRFKGLGEMDVDELAHVALDVKTRSLRIVTAEDVMAATKAIESLMGKDITARKSYITRGEG